MGLPVDEAVDDLDPGALERARPHQILLFVEPRLEFNDRGDRLASLGGVDQRANDRRLLAGAVQRLLDRHDIRVRGGLLDELHHHLETLVGVVDEDVLLLDRGEAIAAMFADSFREARIEGRELQVRAILIDQLRQVGHAEEAAGFGGDGVRGAERFLDLVDQALGHSRFELEADDAAAPAALDRRAEIEREVLCLLFDLDVAVADDAERAPAQQLIFRKQIVGLAADQRFERDIAANLTGDAHEARHARRGHDQLADAGLALFQLENQAQPTVGDEREGMGRVDRLRRQHREDLLAEVGVEPCLGLGIEWLIADDAHRGLVEQDLEQRPDLVLAGHPPVGFGGDRRELLRHGQPVDRLFFDAERLVRF